MTERRKHLRRRTLLSGRLEIAALNGWSLDCTVRNLSETGARLALPGDIVVPQNVSLAISNGSQRQAKLIWYSQGHAGFALSERRTAPRPTPANDTAPARQPAGASRLEARMAAIVARHPADRSHFTGI
ncbi:MAG: PilZ domain-containing protein [Caulobacteraceae bacterium]|nr:PilZ domain-containing protein [Caulobacter sp.]